MYMSVLTVFTKICSFACTTLNQNWKPVYEYEYLHKQISWTTSFSMSMQLHVVYWPLCFHLQFLHEFQDLKLVKLVPLLQDITVMIHRGGGKGGWGTRHHMYTTCASKKIQEGDSCDHVNIAVRKTLRGQKSISFSDNMDEAPSKTYGIHPKLASPPCKRPLVLLPSNYTKWG